MLLPIPLLLRQFPLQRCYHVHHHCYVFDTATTTTTTDHLILRAAATPLLPAPLLPPPRTTSTTTNAGTTTTATTIPPRLQLLPRFSPPTSRSASTTIIVATTHDYSHRHHSSRPYRHHDDHSTATTILLAHANPTTTRLYCYFCLHFRLLVMVVCQQQPSRVVGEKLEPVKRALSPQVSLQSCLLWEETTRYPHRVSGVFGAVEVVGMTRIHFHNVSSQPANTLRSIHLKNKSISLSS
jgi:hypothetical protein